MPIKKTIADRRNTGVDMTFFNIDRVEIVNAPIGNKAIHITLGGYLNEMQYQNGRNPVESKTVLVPLDEPDGGDRFTSLREAAAGKHADIVMSAQKLAMKTELWEGGTEVE